jgi:anti-sigma regulatory factor (Ser/Thr protein kinase)
MVGPIEVQLPRDASASSGARRLLGESMAGKIDADVLDRSKLLVSELVNNAVLHGHGKITLRVDRDENRLYVEVIDEGSGFERVVRENDFDQVGGWGLTLVEAESSRWGVHEGTTHVWFEIDATGPRVGEDKNPGATDSD